MSDSGFSNLPPEPKIGPKAYPPARSEQQARVQDVTGDLQRVARPVKIEGTVIARKADNTVRVRTDRGDIELVLRGRPESIPREGERVEVTVERGRPPRQASVKRLPPESASPRAQAGEAKAPKVQPKARPEESAPPRQRSGEAETRPADQSARARPVEPDIPLDVRRAEPAPRPAPLPPESIVRLIPLSPAQAQEIIVPQQQDNITARMPLPLSLPETAALRAEIAVHRAISEQAQRVLSIRSDEQITRLAREALPHITPVSTNIAEQSSFQQAVQALPPALRQPAEQVFTFIQQRPPLAPPPQTVFTAGNPQQQVALPQTAQAIAPVRMIPQPATQPAASAPQTRVIVAGLSRPDPLTQTPLYERLSLLPVILPDGSAGMGSKSASAPQPAVTGLIQTGAVPAAPVLLTESAQSRIPEAPQNTRLNVPRLDVSIKTIAPPQVQLVPPFAGESAEKIVPGNITHSSPGSAPAAAQEPQFKPQFKLQNLIRTVRPGHAPPPQIQPRAENIMAQVIGFTPKQLPVLTLTLPSAQNTQPFTLQFQASNLPIGTQLELAPQTGQITTSPLSASAAAATAATAPPLIQMLSQFQWPAMNDLGQAIQQQAAAASAQAAQAMSATVPNPANAAQIPPAVLMFVAALRGGDISGWLNERTIDTLRRAGREDVINRLSRDFAGLNRLSAEPSGQDWRTMPLPMMWEGELHHIMLYYRRDERENEEENSKGTRFILDLNLDQMGTVQLDAFHRAGRLDLIVRTQTQLSADMQKRMRGLYIGALEQADVKGELSFQGKAEKFVKIDTARIEEGFSA